MHDFVIEPPEDSTGTDTSQAWRTALRKQVLTRRELLSPQEHQALSAAICNHLQTILPPAHGSTLGFCWPIRKEPDPFHTVEAWLAQGGLAALPVVQGTQQALIFRQWQPGCALENDRYGIPTPSTGLLLHPAVLLVPVNAFDDACFRLGYGGGFFDRTLAQISPRPLVIGLGFELGRVSSICPQAHDQALDWIVTEAGCFRRPGLAPGPV